jgi:hypothetical protein
MKISGIILAGIALGLLLIPAFAGNDIYFLNTGSGSGSFNDTTICSNVGSGKTIHVVGSNCDAKSLIGSADISITNSSNTITIDYNGTIASDDTVCTNVGTGSQVYKDGECNFRTILGSSDISVTQQTNTITVDFNGTDNNFCTSTGTGEPICESANNINSAIAGTGITIADTTGDLTFTNSGVIQLCSATASGGETSLTCTFSTSANVKAFTVYATISSSGTTDNWGLRLNADSGTNYAQRTSSNGGADNTATSQTSILPSQLSQNQIYYYYFSCLEPISSQEKHCIGGMRSTSGTGAGNAPARVEIVAKWANTSSVVTSIQWVRTAGTGTMNANSNIIVWGVNQ